MTDVSIIRSQLQGYDSYTLQNNTLRLTIVPSLGGKMTELRDLSDDYDFLLPSQLCNGVYTALHLGDSFESHDTSGFDECFPTIEPSSGYPDHGELWSRPWNCISMEDELILSIDGVNREYFFEKRIRLEGNRIALTYRVTNRGNEPIQFLWSAHPLLRVAPGMQLLLPDSVKRVLVNWSSDEKVGHFGDLLSWPMLPINGSAIDLSVVQDRSLGKAMKLFTESLEDGFVGLHDPQRNRALMFDFDPLETPYLGLWFCYGGWPSGAKEKHFTIGLEPCNGRPDALAHAVSTGECGTLEGGSTKEWNIAVSVVNGSASDAVTSVRSVRSTTLSLT